MANNLKKTGSKTDLEPAFFPPTGNHFFQYLKLEKKVILMKSLPTYSERNPLSPSVAS